MYYGKGKLSLGKILSETLVRRILVPDETRQLGAEIVADLIVLKVHIVIPDLKVDSDQVDQRDVVTGADLGTLLQKGEEANTLVL
jgi:hypothetical protein